MNTQTCANCGSNNIEKRDGVFVCQYCGSRFSATGAAKAAPANDLESLYKKARRAQNARHYADAEKYYGLIAQQDPDSWEAVFYCEYLSGLHLRGFPGESMHLSVYTMRYASSKVSLSAKTICAIIANIDDQQKRETAALNYFAALSAIGSDMYKSNAVYYNAPGQKKKDKKPKYRLGLTDAAITLCTPAFESTRWERLNSTRLDAARKNLFRTGLAILNEDKEVRKQQKQYIKYIENQL